MLHKATQRGFFVAQTRRELDALARESTTMEQAKKALSNLWTLRSANATSLEDVFAAD